MKQFYSKIKSTHIISSILLTLLLFTSCENNDESLMEVNKSHELQDYINVKKSYFKSRGFETSFDKPDHLKSESFLSKLHVFESIEEFESYINKENNGLLVGKSFVEEDWDAPDESGDDGGNFEIFTRSYFINGTPLTLNISFTITDNCFPSGLKSSITGDAYHYGRFHVTNHYLKKGVPEQINPQTHQTIISYGVEGILTYKYYDDFFGGYIYLSKYPKLSGEYRCFH